MSLSASEHRAAARKEIDKGEISLYRLNKATYDVIDYVNASGQSVIVTREGRQLAIIEPVESGE